MSACGRSLCTDRRVGLWQLIPLATAFGSDEPTTLRSHSALNIETPLPSVPRRPAAGSFPWKTPMTA